jgi:XTP/dITP diphosphohydrolase
MQELLIATKNPGKYKEITEALAPLLETFEFVFLGDLDVCDSDFIEDGESFSENAYKKAKYYFDKTGLFSFAEDSGLLVEALRGELGVKTRRWGAGEGATDEEWVEYFMKRMEKEVDRRAKFVCNACFFDGKSAKFFEGETFGVITDELMAPIIRGLPLSSCFLPEGCDRVYAALEEGEKNKISHRGKAVTGFREWISLDLNF